MATARIMLRGSSVGRHGANPGEQLEAQSSWST